MLGVKNNIIAIKEIVTATLLISGSGRETQSDFTPLIAGNLLDFRAEKKWF